MTRTLWSLGLLAGTAGMLAACAPQEQAPVVSGYGQKRMVVSNVTSRRDVANPLRRDEVDAQPAATASLATISPAAGPARTVAATPAPVAIEPKMISHRVTANDTAYKLARTYNTSVDRILKDNNLASMTEIKEGQTLTIAQNSKPQVSAWDDMKRMLSEPVLVDGKVPATAAAQPVAQPVEKVAMVAVPQQPAVQPVVQSVVRGATPPAQTALALPSAKALADIEPAAGERPGKSDEGVNFVSYTVQPKETIYRISLKYNVSVLDIMAANDFEQPQDLKANAVIRVPVKTAITQQLAVKNANVSPAAGDSAPVEPVVVAQAGEPVKVAMLSTAATGTSEASREDLETKAVKQQAQKDELLPVVKDKPLDKSDTQKAELQRGQIDQAAAHSKGLVWPVHGKVVKKFGDDGSGVARTGINIAVPQGTAVLASEGGTVLYADDGLKIYGKLVLLRHDNGMVSAYAHNSYLLVRKNERVQKGQVIALSGATGNVESPQLHFELRQHASAIDPLAMLPRL